MNKSTKEAWAITLSNDSMKQFSFSKHVELAELYDCIIKAVKDPDKKVQLSDKYPCMSQSNIQI